MTLANCWREGLRREGVPERLVMDSSAMPPDGANHEVPEHLREKFIYDCQKFFRSAKFGDPVEMLLFCKKLYELLAKISATNN